MVKTYIAFKSAEEAGAETPNILGLEDWTGAPGDLAPLVAGDLMSTSEVVSGGDAAAYTLPYPVGSGDSGAVVVQSPNGSAHIVIRDLNSQSVSATVANMIAAGYKIPDVNEAPDPTKTLSARTHTS